MLSRAEICAAVEEDEKVEEQCDIRLARCAWRRMWVNGDGGEGWVLDCSRRRVGNVKVGCRLGIRRGRPSQWDICLGFC